MNSDKVTTIGEKTGRKNFNKVAGNFKEISKKANKLDLGGYLNLYKQVKVSISMLKDFKTKKYTNVPWKTIFLISTAVLYFWNPFDLIPDLIPVLGYSDDAALFAAIFASARADLKSYTDWKNGHVDLS